MNRSLLPWLVAIAFVSLGVGSAVAPEALAENYGLPIEDGTGRAYIRSLGARDAVIGLLVAYFLRSGNRTAVTATLAISTLAGFTDFAVVKSTRGDDAPSSSLAIHFFGTLGLLFTAALSALAPEPD